MGASRRSFFCRKDAITNRWSIIDAIGPLRGARLRRHIR